MKAPDRIDAARQALGEVLSHPVTWAPFVPIAAAYAFIGTPWWVCLPVLLVVMAVLFSVWSRQWPRLMGKARTELRRAHRTAENAELDRRIVRVAEASRERPANHLLDAMREAMEIKAGVENRLLADGVVTEHEEEVGAMVSDLVRTMIGEAERLTLAEGGEVSRAAAQRFDKAAATLRRAFAEIDVILDPVPEDLRLPAEDDPLSRASERLDERLAQARGVRRHLERGMIVHDPEPAPEGAQPQPAPPTAQ